MEEQLRTRRSEKQEKYYSEVIRLHFEEKQGFKTIVRKIPVSLFTIKNWCYKFEAETYQKEESMKKETSKSEQQPEPQTESELKAEIARLKQALAKEQLRADAYDEMINLAESHFNIPIRKKSGTKR